jgi:hypothetical protein
MARKQNPKLASARAYYRLAAKAERASSYTLAGQYRDRADRLVAEAQRQRDYIRRTFRKGA